ncbi:MAG TPA: DUF3108 domain-containing protein [Ignavibacteriaceae bacterium]|nr:DUF3108 domain-containing protein [Ignavibacteriaceae bacterium]
MPVLFFFIPSTGSGSLTHQYIFKFHKSADLQAGEDFTYLVSYSLVKLGEVRIKILDVKETGDVKIYRAAAYMDSYNVPFVTLHQIYESTFSQDNRPLKFRGIVKGDEYTTFTDYEYDYDKSSIHVKKGKVKPYQLWTDSSTGVDKIYQDGLSILFFARMNFGKYKSVNVPCFVNEKKVNTKLNYYTDVTDVSIDAVDYDVACLRLDGETDFVSVFGLTGYFQGWFSNDEAVIPIVAEMKVIIGNVRLELIKWNRKGWKPPEYKSE